CVQSQVEHLAIDLTSAVGISQAAGGNLPRGRFDGGPLGVNDVGKDEKELQHSEQHHNRTNERVQEKLDRRVETVLAAPNFDHEIHRHEHHFPEDEKQEKVG